MSDTKRFAIIDDGVVTNVVLWDETTDWTPPEGTTTVLVPDDSMVGIGWTYTDGIFNAPPIEPVPPPSAEEILATNTATRNQYLTAATLAIAPLQDAVDIGEATPDDEAMLLKWKQFRVAVNRVVLTLANPTWPVPPQPGYGAAVAPANNES